MQASIVEGNRQKCGYAAVADMATGQLCTAVPLYSVGNVSWPASTSSAFGCSCGPSCHIACMIHDLYRKFMLSQQIFGPVHCWGHACRTARNSNNASIVYYMQVHTVSDKWCCFCTTGELEDSMESFFLSETSKYLFLLQANTTDLPDHYVFTTEGHLLPPFPSSTLPPKQAPTATPISQSASWVDQCLRSWFWFMPSFSGLWFPPTDQPSEFTDAVQSGRTASLGLASKASSAALQKCASFCTRLLDADIRNRQQLLQDALPLLPLAAQDAAVVR